MKYSGWPEPGELVVGKIDEIDDFGVFVDLDEYEDTRGLCHISEVASGWIKNVRDHVREGQTVVAKVLDVDTGSQQIDLSIKDVNEHQRKEKIQEWKNEQKADKWMSLAFGEDVTDDEYAEIANECWRSTARCTMGSSRQRSTGRTPSRRRPLRGGDRRHRPDGPDRCLRAVRAGHRLRRPVRPERDGVDIIKERCRPRRATSRSPTRSNSK